MSFMTVLHYGSLIDEFYCVKTPFLAVLKLMLLMIVPCDLPVHYYGCMPFKMCILL